MLPQAREVDRAFPHQAKFKNDVFPVGVAEVAHAAAKGFSILIDLWIAINEHAHTRHAFLLSTGCGQRANGRAEPQDQIAPPHSITSPAKTRPFRALAPVGWKLTQAGFRHDGHLL